MCPSRMGKETYGFDPHDAANTSKDKDNDGYTNIEEYLNGTNPTEFIDYTIYAAAQLEGLRGLRIT